MQFFLQGNECDLHGQLGAAREKAALQHITKIERTTTVINGNTVVSAVAITLIGGIRFVWPLIFFSLGAVARTTECFNR